MKLAEVIFIIFATSTLLILAVGSLFMALQMWDEWRETKRERRLRAEHREAEL